MGDPGIILYRGSGAKSKNKIEFGIYIYTI